MKTSSRNAQLAAIHTAARAHKLIDGTDRSLYVAMLNEVANVTSARDLDDAGLHKVLNHLNGSNRRKVTSIRPGTPQSLILWLWTCLHRDKVVTDGSPKALRAWVAGETERSGHSDTALEFMPEEVLSVLINQLKSWCARSNVRWRHRGKK